MNQALEDWRLMQRVPEGSPDLEIAAAVILNAFRELKEALEIASGSKKHLLRSLSLPKDGSR